MAAKRLGKELHELYSTSPLNYAAAPYKGNLLHWHATILGLRGTPYANGFFSLNLKFSESYPFMPPRVTFTTRIYHCNVDTDGYICFDMLTTKWSAVFTVKKIMEGICRLLAHPDINDPYDELVAKLYREDRQRYLFYAMQWTMRYARPAPQDFTYLPLGAALPACMLNSASESEEE